MRRQADKRRRRPDALIAAQHREQKCQTNGDDDAVAVDETSDALQVADPRLLEVERRLTQSLDAAERLQYESQRGQQAEWGAARCK